MAQYSIESDFYILILIPIKIFIKWLNSFARKSLEISVIIIALI